MLVRAVSDWIQRRRVLSEVKDLQKNEEWALERDEGNPVNQALLALAAGDRKAAADRWEEALTRAPAFAKRSRSALDILMRLDRLDEAEALMREGMRREPRASYYAAGLASVIEHKGDLQAAVMQWTNVRKKFPREWMGFVRSASCLRRMGDISAAELLHKKSLELFPSQIHAWLEWGYTADASGDWSESLRRWQIVRDRYRHNIACVGIARALEGLGRFEEAERELADAQFRFPIIIEIAIARPRLAERMGRPEEAVALWADVRRRFPLDRFGYESGAKLLATLGRHQEADEILEAAIIRFPEEGWPRIQFAEAAERRGDQALAAARRRMWDQPSPGEPQSGEQALAPVPETSGIER